MKMMKTCKKCNVEKDTSCFYKNNTYASGFMSKCKECQKAMTLANERANPDRRAKHNKKQYAANKDYHADYCKQYRLDKPEVQAALNGKRRAAKLNATPDWLTDTHKAHMKRTYALAAMMAKATGVPYHVDHIVPLQNEFVCGLHVPWNLQALRADLNLSKSNKYDPQDNSSYTQRITSS